MNLALKRLKNEITYTLPNNVPARYLSGGRYIFTAYGCALLERDSGSSWARLTLATVLFALILLAFSFLFALQKGGAEELVALSTRSVFPVILK